MNSVIQKDLAFITNSQIIDWERFRNKTVLISGANGMLPSYMIETLLYLNLIRQMNISVYALVRNRDKAQKTFKDYLSDEHLHFMVQDVCDPIKETVDFSYVIHAASQAAPSYYAVDPVGTLRANTLGTLNMLEVARKSRSEGFLFFSTGAVYGDVGGDDIVLDENTCGSINTLNPRSCYPESKRLGENACACYAYQYHVPAKVVRIFHTMGPHMNLNDGRIFADFCKNIVNNQDLVLKSDGLAKRAFIYIADATIAYFKVLLDGQVAEAYNVGGDVHNEISMRDLAYLLVETFPEKHLKVVFDIPQSDATYRTMRTPEKRILPSLDKIYSLGWRPTYSIQDCFKMCLSYLLSDSCNTPPITGELTH
jgi:nucleoside-diphosphate-sugar epimerase